MDLAELELSHFAPLVAQRFKLSLPGRDGVYEFELVQATASRHAPSRRSKRRPFSLLFKGPPEFRFPQATYQVEHETLGVIQFFLVPVVVDEDGRFLEAVFA